MRKLVFYSILGGLALLIGEMAALTNDAYAYTGPSTDGIPGEEQTDGDPTGGEPVEEYPEEEDEEACIAPDNVDETEYGDTGPSLDY